MRLTSEEYENIIKRGNVKEASPYQTRVNRIREEAAAATKKREEIEAKAGIFKAAEKISKYHNQKVVVDGIRFDSKREAKRYHELRLMEKGGQIEDLRLQVPFILAPSVVIQGRKRPPLQYVADFVYNMAGREVVEDSKGMVTKEYRIKRHLMAVKGIEIKEV